MGFFGSGPENFDKIIYKSAYGKQANIKSPKGWSYSVATGFIIGEFDKSATREWTIQQMTSNVNDEYGDEPDWDDLNTLDVERIFDILKDEGVIHVTSSRKQGLRGGRQEK